MTDKPKQDFITKKITDLINGKVTYDKFGGQYFWIAEPGGGSQMLAEMRGWGHIQNMFKLTGGKIDEEAAGKFQDEVGHFIAAAINEKIQRDALAPSVGGADMKKFPLEGLCGKCGNYKDKLDKNCLCQDCYSMGVRSLPTAPTDEALRLVKLRSAPSVLTDDVLKIIDEEIEYWDNRKSRTPEQIGAARYALDKLKAVIRSRLTGK